MSDVMLCGILRMPYELWKDDPLQEPQVLSRMREAATELEKRAAEIERLRTALREVLAATQSDVPDEQAANHASEIAHRALEPPAH